MAIYQKKKNGNFYYSVYVPGLFKRKRGCCFTNNRKIAELVENGIKASIKRDLPKDKIIKIIEAIYDGDKPQDIIAPAAIRFEAERIQRMENRQNEESNLKEKRRHAARFNTWLSDNYPAVSDVREIDLNICRCYAEFLRDSGKASKTVKNILGNLSADITVLQRAHDGLVNNWVRVMPHVTGENRGNCFTPAEAFRIFTAGDASGYGWGIAARIAAATGLRMGDVLKLRYENIIDGVLVLDPKKTKKFNIKVVLPLPAELLKIIGKGKGYIMPVLAADYRPRKEMIHPFSDVLRAAHVSTEKYTFHSFRHYFRTRLAAAGVSDSVAMRLGGWTQRSTAARYDHDEHRKELGEALEKAWNA